MTNTAIGRSNLQRSLGLATIVVVVSSTVAAAQTAPAGPSPNKKSHSVSGSPLDTLRSTHIWADVAPAKDFVEGSRPDPKTLDYAPLTGVGADPERPKPRDAANVLALQAELEKTHDLNEGKGRKLGRSRSTKAAAPR